jgi:hypothetical protein
MGLRVRADFSRAQKKSRACENIRHQCRRPRAEFYRSRRLVLFQRGVRFGLGHLRLSHYQGLMPSHLDGACRPRWLRVGTVGCLKSSRSCPIALPSPLVQLIGELLSDRVVAALVGLMGRKVSCVFARFFLSARCFLRAHIAPLFIYWNGFVLLPVGKTLRNLNNLALQNVSL